MKYNFEYTPSRRISKFGNKWTLYSKDVLPMWIADMDLPTAPQIQDALHKQVEHGVLGYELLDNKELYKVIAARIKKLYDWDVDPDWIVYTPGVNNGYNVAARALCSPKKGYLIQPPVYNEFQDTEHKTGMKQYTNPLVKKVKGNSISYEVDFDSFERGIKKSGMFLLCYPHNPIGKIFSRAELKQMADICIENGVMIVSDEIHGELLLGDSKFMPLAKISRKIEKNTITLISASKTFNVPGLTCAFAIIPNAKIRKRFSDIASGMSVEISTPGLVAARTAYLGRADAWMMSLRHHLTANRDYILNFLDNYLPEVRATKPDATYLMWLDCTDLKLKPSPYEYFLKNAKVALSDGKIFGNGNEQFVRLNFGTSRKLVRNALERINRALK